MEKENGFSWEMIDSADTVNYAAIKDELKKDLQETASKSLEKAPEPIKKEIGLAADDLYQSMDAFRQTEVDLGPEPEIWKQFGVHHGAIKEDLHSLSGAVEKSLQSKSLEEKAINQEFMQKACDKTVRAFKHGKGFLEEERNRIIAREQKLDQEIKEIKEMMKNIQEHMKESRLSPENMYNYMMVGSTFLKQVEQIRKESRMQNQKPSQVAHLLKNVRTCVSEVHKNVREIAGKIKESIKNKAIELTDRAVKKAASLFDKAINYLEDRKEEVLNLSPLEKQNTNSVHDANTIPIKASRTATKENNCSIPTPKTSKRKR